MTLKQIGYLKIIIESGGGCPKIFNSGCGECPADSTVQTFKKCLTTAKAKLKKHWFKHLLFNIIYGITAIIFFIKGGK